MAHVEVNPSAPAVGASEALIHAPIDIVWQVLSDFEGWPTWNPSVSFIQLNGPFEVGMTFVWVAGGSKIVSRVEEIEPPHRLVWSGTTWGIRAIHVWNLAERDAGTHVHTTESFEGLVAKLFAGRMKKMLAEALSQGTSALKEASEARHRTQQA